MYHSPQIIKIDIKLQILITILCFSRIFQILCYERIRDELKEKISRVTSESENKKSHRRIDDYPAETRIISGLNLCAQGTITWSNTVRMAISPDPPGKGRFKVAPSPAPRPI